VPTLLFSYKCVCVSSRWCEITCLECEGLVWCGVLGRSSEQLGRLVCSGNQVIAGSAEGRLFLYPLPLDAVNAVAVRLPLLPVRCHVEMFVVFACRCDLMPLAVDEHPNVCRTAIFLRFLEQL
jgi:hypothetical protein